MTRDDLARRAHELETTAPDVVRHARESARRMGVGASGSDTVSDALVEVESLTPMDVDVPTDSRSAASRAAKLAIKRLSSWYLRYLADQVEALGQALVGLGLALADRTDRLERSASRIEERLDALEAKVSDLESRPGSNK